MLTYQRICQLSCLVSQLLKSSKAVMIRDGWPKMTENCKRRVFEATVVGYLQAGHQVSWSRSFFKASALSSWSHFRGRKAFFPRCYRWLYTKNDFQVSNSSICCWIPQAHAPFAKCWALSSTLQGPSWKYLSHGWILHIYIYIIYI